MGILCLVFSLFFTFSEWKKLKDGQQGRYYQVKEAYQALGDSMILSNKKYLVVHSEVDKTGGTMRGYMWYLGKYYLYSTDVQLYHHEWPLNKEKLLEESDYLVILRDTPSPTAYTQELIGRSLQLGIYDLKELQAQKFLYSF